MPYCSVLFSCGVQWLDTGVVSFLSLLLNVQWHIQWYVSLDSLKDLLTFIGASPDPGLRVCTWLPLHYALCQLCFHFTWKWYSFEAFFVPSTKISQCKTKAITAGPNWAGTNSWRKYINKEGYWENGASVPNLLQGKEPSYHWWYPFICVVNYEHKENKMRRKEGEQFVCSQNILCICIHTLGLVSNKTKLRQSGKDWFVEITLSSHPSYANLCLCCRLSLTQSAVNLKDRANCKSSRYRPSPSSSMHIFACAKYAGGSFMVLFLFPFFFF